MIDPRTFNNFAEVPLYIGYHGENLVTGVDIDLANVLPDGWGAGLLLRRPGEGRGAEYDAVSVLEGSTLRATFETFDTMIEGRGEATVELRGPNGEKRKSDTAQTVIPHALDLNGTPPERPELYRPAAAQDVIDSVKLSKAAQATKTDDMMQPVGVDDDGKLWVPPGGKKPYLSLERVSRYLYNISFAEAPDVDADFIPAGCSAYVQDGKLYRNLDWSYDHEATFHVKLPGMEGLAFMAGLTDTEFDDELIAQLPYRMVDGVNEHGIMMSTHVLYNDWDAHGHGTIPLTRLPYIVLSRVKSMATIEDDLDGVLDNLVTTPALDAMEYLIQVLVTDGTTTYVLRPGNAADGLYEAVNITSNSKLSNFWWVSAATVTRQQLQNRPTGVERWNMMPCPLEELRFTKAYEEPTRLSEFIGLRGTTKDSTDEELTEIYETAHDMYLERTRDGLLWQTMHSAVYSSKGLEHLWIQEDWEKDYIASAGGSSDELWKPTVDSAGNISWAKSTSQTPPATQNIKGQPGSPGADGITPTIGENGNWYLGDTDTGKPSRGEQGNPGQDGSDAEVTKANIEAALGYTPADRNEAYQIVEFNQLIPTSASGRTVRGITFTNNNDGSWTLSGTTTENGAYVNLNNESGVQKFEVGHSYAVIGVSGHPNINISLININSGSVTVVEDSIIQCTALTSETGSYARLGIWQIGVTVENEVIWPQIFDLTQMFGAGKEPTLDEFRSVFHAQYYPYNTGKEISIPMLREVMSLSAAVSASKWNGKNALVCGDSLSAAGKWQLKLASDLGLNVATHALGGLTIVEIIDGGTHSGTTLPPLSQQDVAGKDLLIFFAGTNNAGMEIGEVGDVYPTTNTVCGQVKYAINSIFSLLAAANNLQCRVIFVSPYCFGASPYNDDGYDMNADELAQAIEDTANYDGLPCFNAYRYSGINRYTWAIWSANPTPSTGDVINDQLHLNDAGYAHLGELIAQFVDKEG